MGTLEECASANSSIKNLSNKDLIHAHRSFFSQFVSESLEMFKGEEFVDVRRRFERVCHYNGHDRELYPGFTMMCAYKVFEKSDKLTSENLRDMSMLAWCFESLATSAILTDDIMDNEGFRWKNPCWFRQPNVGMTALTDFSLLRASGFYMMKKYFGGHPCYQTLFYLMNKMIEGMVVGQTIDINVEKAFKNSRKINLLKMEDYINACRYKCYVPYSILCTCRNAPVR
ncbi:hypothetical protein FQR65_LT08694 [Abscondita terminalis]|nr:hypothetical protein FQR65_LT08694 [Abscondita terminalis]